MLNKKQAHLPAPIPPSPPPPPTTTNRCSNGDESETTGYSASEGNASFTGGAITTIEAAAHTNTTVLEFLGLVYVGGIGPNATGIEVYSEEGPFA